MVLLEVEQRRPYVEALRLLVRVRLRVGFRFRARARVRAMVRARVLDRATRGCES